LRAAQTTAGTPATNACGRNASSKINNFKAFAEYDATVLFLLGTNLHKAWLIGPKDTAGNTVPSTNFAKSTAAYKILNKYFSSSTIASNLLLIFWTF
jgi:hypothetical protein